MPKKKRQGEPASGGGGGGAAARSDDSSDSSDDTRNAYVAGCSHINKSVDINSVKKALQKSAGLCTQCEQCKAAASTSAAAGCSAEGYAPAASSSADAAAGEEVFDLAAVEDDSLWMCLKCGHQACGRYKNKHALHHYATPRSDSHSICLNTSKWSVWCYRCDNEVTGKKKLHECVEYVKKFAASYNMKLPNSTANVMSGDIIETKMPMTILSKSSKSEFVARGLRNLGNTCFFNSVMQCLGQTPYLLKLLEETAESGQLFRLPGGKVVLDGKNKKTVSLDPLEGILDEWKPLTRNLANTLGELQSGQQDTFNPFALFNCLTQRMTMFGGGQQHDSHELLRHLLDGVREEDLRRYQSVILKHLGFSTKTNPATVEPEQRVIIRQYGVQASELLPTEQVFRGVLVSTLKCEDCGHTSHREENFLDLSLPIAENQRPPVLRRKADDGGDDHKPSKHQAKKERRVMKKARRYGNGSQYPAMARRCAELAAAAATAGAEDAPMERADSNGKSDSQSDADVEDNVEDSANSRTPEEGPNKGTESGYNSDKNSPDNAFPEGAGNESAASPVAGMLSASPFTPDSPVTSPESSETNIDLGSPSCGLNSPIEGGNDEFERPESRLAFVENKNEELKVDLEKLSIEADKKQPDGAYGGAPVSDEEQDHMGGDDIDDEMVGDDDEVGKYTGTISIPMIEEGECSVQSCLYQFTSSELMTGNNKVRCDLCTKRSSGQDKKPVLTNATKQLLIYNPPAVLILHLKRFQVCHFRPSKITKAVKFPMQLDIAPFCSKRALQLPTFDADQKKVLYSLYGLVEHSGSFSSGHYIAYIKVRTKLADDNYRWHFLPRNAREMVNKHLDDAKPDAHKWFYVSDSSASVVSEERVLTANAYLLFYERIL